jgi:hypothetical protein
MVPVSDGEPFLSLQRAERKSLSRTISNSFYIHIISTDSLAFSAGCGRFPLHYSHHIHTQPPSLAGACQVMHQT